MSGPAIGDEGMDDEADTGRPVVGAAGYAIRREAASPIAIDYLAMAYLVVTGGLAVLSGTAVGLRLALAHLVAVGLVLALAHRPVPTRRLPAFFRVAYPLAAMPLLYLELATLNQLQFLGYFDPVVQGWEAALFGSQLSVDASRWIPSLWVSELMHMGYFSYYFIVPGAAIAVFMGREVAGLERLAFTVSLAFLVCYTCFAVFPVAGPRYEFPPIDGPQVNGVFFALVHRILEGGSSKGTAFPSSHVAAAVAAWLATRQESPLAFRIVAPFAATLLLGTVYGRFHYGVDAAAGLLVAWCCHRAAPWLIGRLGAAGAPRDGRTGRETEGLGGASLVTADASPAAADASPAAADASPAAADASPAARANPEDAPGNPA
ncbi:MAG: phosphatase PAP2 family protein [Gemmatimonadota bacterium]